MRKETPPPLTCIASAAAGILLCALLLPGIAPTTAQAVQWHAVGRTERHKVAIDMDSVRLTDLGRLAVWIRFIPLSEAKRKEAAAVYGKSEYRRHLEYYEIDCSEHSAVLELTDIIGPSGKRLARLTGGGNPDAIVADSVLDKTARKICPDLEESTVEEEAIATAADSAPGGEIPSATTAEEVQQRIAVGVRRTTAEPNNHDAWVELGNAYYDADMPEQAIEAYGHALRLKADDIDVLNDQGAMFRQAGNANQAVKNFERVITLDPTNLESLYNLGYVLAFDLNNTQRAKEIWRRYLALDPASDTARQVRSFIERSSK